MKADHIARAFAPQEHDDGETLTIGGLELALAPVPHLLPCWAVDVREARTGARLTLGGDCGPNDVLVEHSRDTPLLVAEATVPEPSPGVHLTPAEAGEHARRAGARRLVLTHFTDEVDPDEWAREGARGFGAPVELAHDGAVYTLP